MASPAKKRGATGPLCVGLIGEALLAATGVMKALEPGPVVVRERDFKEADKLLDKLEARIKAFLASDEYKAAKDPDELPYERLRDLLIEPLTDERVWENVAGWPDQMTANEYAESLGRVWGMLQGSMPVKVITHLTGDEMAMPSDTELSRFRRFWDLVRDPMTLFDRLDTGELLDSEVAIYSQAWPGITETLRNMLVDMLDAETAKRRKSDPDWHLPRRKEILLRRVLALPRGAAEKQTLSRVREGYDKNREQTPQQKPTGKIGAGQAEVDGDLTKTQRLQNK